VAGIPALGSKDAAALMMLVAQPPPTMRGGGGPAVAGTTEMEAAAVALMALAVSGDAISGGLVLEQEARTPRV